MRSGTCLLFEEYTRNATMFSFLSQHFWISFAFVSILLVSSTYSHSKTAKISDSLARVNNKNLSKLFRTVPFIQSANAIQDGYYITNSIGFMVNSTTTTTTSESPLYTETTKISRYPDNEFTETETDETGDHNGTSTPAYRMMENSTVNATGHFTPKAYQEDPIDQNTCRCACNGGEGILQTYEVNMDRFKANILVPIAQIKNPQTTKKFEEVLDSLIDHDEDDYDDAEELESLQRPNKYIPLEIIELAHRRPHRDPEKVINVVTTTTTTSPPPVVSLKPANIAPLYSFSFAKPVITLKTVATRAIQFGLPLLVTVVLGNVLTSIEMAKTIDRSAEDNHTNWFINPNHYWNMVGYDNGYYTPYYQMMDMHQQAYQRKMEIDRRMGKVQMPYYTNHRNNRVKPQNQQSSKWNAIDMFNRWKKRI